MSSLPPVRRPQTTDGKGIKTIEISVDACGQLGGQVYEVYSALEQVYALSKFRELHYVDTFQGFREKANGTDPETLYSLRDSHSRFGQFFQSRYPEKAQAYETHKCREFSDVLGEKLFPEILEPIVNAVDAMTTRIQEQAMTLMNERGLVALGEKVIEKPADVELVFTAHPRHQTNKKMRILEDPIINQAVSDVLPEWVEKVKTLSVLNNSKENGHKGRLLELIDNTQQMKSIASALLHHSGNKSAITAMGEVATWIVQSPTIPAMDDLRNNAHKSAHNNVSDKEIWKLPQVAQAVRETNLWPWAQKPYLKQEEHDKLNIAHKNVADEASLAYFTNILSEKPSASKTLFLLVTHDGPLRDDFVKFYSGVTTEKQRSGEGTRKQMMPKLVSQDEYDERGFTKREMGEYAKPAILSGKEFVAFMEKEMVRIEKYSAPSLELSDAMDRLKESVEGLSLFVNRDIQAHGLVKGGSFAARVQTATKQVNNLNGRTGDHSIGL